MLTIYQDSEKTIHFARMSEVDGRLIPVMETPKLTKEDIGNIECESRTITPNRKGCVGCSAEAGSSECTAIRSAVKLHFNLLTGCETIGWHVMRKARPAWQQYRMVADRQAHTKPYRPYAEIYKGKDYTQWDSVFESDIIRLFKKTRPGFKVHIRHKAINQAIVTFGLPKNIPALLAEQPSYVDGDSSDQSQINMIEYTSNIKGIERGIRTKTKIGRFLRRHWPKVPDEDIRNLAAQFQPIEYQIWNTTDDIVRAVEEGPGSCMKGKWDNLDDHPYRVYAPEYGWKVAVGLKGETIVARALINDREFVRTYGAYNDDPHSREYSDAHDGLHQWLEKNGYEHMREWAPDTKLAHIQVKSGVLMPYIDGNNDLVKNRGDHWVITDTRSGHHADNTDGLVSSYANCDMCGDSCDEDDEVEVRYNGGHIQSRCVCESCRDNNYSWVSGAAPRNSERTIEYYVRDYDSVCVDGTDYDRNALPDDIVETTEGNFVPVDAAVYSEIEGGYIEECDAVKLHNDEWAFRVDCSQCAHDSQWYQDDDTVSFAGYTVAKDNVEDFLSELEPEEFHNVFEEARRYLDSDQIERLEADFPVESETEVEEPQTVAE